MTTRSETEAANAGDAWRSPRGSDLGPLLLSLALCYAAAAIGAIPTADDVRTWYPTLARPFFTPPNWLFGPVWSVLYTAMGVALFLLWRAGRSGARNRPALTAFAVQLVLNAGWSLVFFQARLPGLALIWIALLWAAIAWTIRAARGVSRPAAWLLLPYLGWVGFAAVLNAALWWLNR